MDINFFKNFENVTQYILKENEIFKKQQSEISRIVQLQSELFKNNSSICESTIQHLLKESEFLKKQQEISTMIINQLFNSMTKQENEISKIIQLQFQSELFKDNSSIFENLTQQLFKDINNFSKELYLDDNLDLDIKYEDIEKINKKIEQKEAFTKKDLSKLIRFLEILWLFYSFYSELNPDNSEHIKTQQTIKELDNKVSKLLNQEIYYEVTKQVNIRELANSKSKKIVVANPKQKLLIIQNEPYWLQIEYFDEIKNETIIGWVSKKYTKKLD